MTLLAEIRVRNLQKSFGDFVAVKSSTFTVPDGYLDQGQDYWLSSDESDTIGAGVVRSLVHQTTSI